MNKKGFELGFSTIAVILLMLVVVIAVLIAFNTQFRGTFKQIVGIRESVSNFSLPSLGLKESTIQKEASDKKPEIEKEPLCKSSFEEVQAGLDLSKLSSISLETLSAYRINHKDFLEIYEDYPYCPSEYITKINDNLYRLNNELSSRGCKSYFEEVQAGLDLSKLSSMSLETLNDHIINHQAFLDIYEDASYCLSEYVTKIKDNLGKLRAESAKRENPA